MSAKSSTQKFIDKSKAIHGDKYSYEKSLYSVNHVKVIITCEVHGDFTQTPNSHLYGRGCPRCGKESASALRSVSLQTFLKRAKKVHGDKYDYSLINSSNYSGVSSKCHIICKKHGKFEQVGSSHLIGHSCERCSYEDRGKGLTTPLEDVLSRFRSVHGDRFEYDLSSYSKTKAKMRIKCPTHGWFEQLVDGHAAGKGCAKCYRESSIKRLSSQKSNTKEFLEKAKAVHGSTYIYSKSEYVLNNLPLIITCPHHGDFLQRPNGHLLGAGCPVCANLGPLYKDMDKDECRKVKCSIYLIKMYNDSESFFKVGISRLPRRRLLDLASESGYKVECLELFKGNLFDCVTVEHKTFSHFSSFKYPPLALFSGHTECFNSSTPLLEVSSFIKTELSLAISH